MNAQPIYRNFLHTPPPRRTRFGRWAWIVADGYTRILETEYALTRHGARRAQRRYAATCVWWRDAQLAAAVERLHVAGIDVTARVDERGRVCVRSECPCSDADHRRVMREFLRLAGAVRWVLPETEVQALTGAQATGSDSTAGGDPR